MGENTTKEVEDKKQEVPKTKTTKKKPKRTSKYTVKQVASLIPTIIGGDEALSFGFDDSIASRHPKECKLVQCNGDFDKMHAYFHGKEVCMCKGCMDMFVKIVHRLGVVPADPVKLDGKWKLFKPDSKDKQSVGPKARSVQDARMFTRHAVLQVLFSLTPEEVDQIGDAFVRNRY